MGYGSGSRHETCRIVGVKYGIRGFVWHIVANTSHLRH